jgi:hypothetical protein
MRPIESNLSRAPLTCSTFVLAIRETILSPGEMQEVFFNTPNKFLSGQLGKPWVVLGSLNPAYFYPLSRLTPQAETLLPRGLCGCLRLAARIEPRLARSAKNLRGEISLAAENQRLLADSVRPRTTSIACAAAGWALPLILPGTPSPIPVQSKSHLRAGGHWVENSKEAILADI